MITRPCSATRAARRKAEEGSGWGEMGSKKGKNGATEALRVHKPKKDASGVKKQRKMEAKRKSGKQEPDSKPKRKGTSPAFMSRKKLRKSEKKQRALERDQEGPAVGDVEMADANHN